MARLNFSSVQWSWDGVSGRGGRRRNEDCWGAINCADRSAVVLADGLGGHSDGHIASKLAVRAALAQVERHRNLDPASAARQCVEGAIEALLKAQRERGSDLSSTLAVVIAENEVAAWAHCGDSRIYSLRPGSPPLRLTVDHSLAVAVLPEEERLHADVRSDERRNVLVSTLTNENPVVDVSETKLCTAGEVFALCSDGFWEHAEEGELFSHLQSPPSARDTIKRLKALHPFDGDNHTLVYLYDHG